MVKIEASERLKKLPPYLFVEIDKAKRKAIVDGKDIIDFGVGDPDMPTPQFIIDALNKAGREPANHRYALDAGLKRLREAIAKWYKKRFNVTLNSDKEVYPLIGSKEGIAHLPLAIINPKDKVLVPDPCYPPYRSGVIFAGGKVITVPLLSKNKFLPEIKKIKNAKLMFVNYPNNPTSACADKGFLKELINVAEDKGIMVASDLAYSEIYFGRERPPSLLEIDGAKDIAVEFNSLSKTFNMTGWRIGWVCGNEKIISYLARVKTNIDSGIFQAIQLAAIAALESDMDALDSMRSVYQERRDLLVEGLNSLGWKIEKPKATFYVWAKIPGDVEDSLELVSIFLNQANVVVTPGVGFGKYGEGFVRFALTVSCERIKEALVRLRRVL